MSPELLAALNQNTNAEEIRGTRDTHRNVVARTQGRRDGWFAVVGEIRRLSGEAFAQGDDRTAESLRDLARKFGVPNPPHPYLTRLDDQEQESLEVVEAACARLAALTAPCTEE